MVKLSFNQGVNSNKGSAQFKLVSVGSLHLTVLHLKIHSTYSHLSNNRGGWNKRVWVQKMQNTLDFSVNF